MRTFRARRLPPTKWLIFSLGIGACCTLFGCKDPEKVQIENLTQVVLKYRGAEDIDKLARAEDIHRVVCSQKDVCDVRDKCFDAATGYVKATSMTQEAKARFAKVESGDLKKDDPTVLALPKMIDDAEAALIDSREKMTSCDAMLENVARAHHVL